MLSLSDITLVSADDSFTLAQRAMLLCQKNIEFASAFLCPLNNISYSMYCLKDMARHIKTGHALIVQYDSWIIYPEMWTDEFLGYDYIGAKWPHHNNAVGNGGFSLRSKRLLDILASWNYEGIETGPEDDFICRKRRGELEECGIKFAPQHIADKFSYERHVPTGKTFGFHGLFNLWRHVDDAEMIKMAGLFPDYVVKKTEYHALINNYRNLGKFGVVDILCKRLA